MSSKILIVEDAPDLVQLYKFFLAGSGAEIVVAESCHKALEFLKTEKPQVIVMDLTLHDMATEQFYEEFLAIPEIESVDTILISGREDLPSWADLFGAKTYFKKPVSRDKLSQAVQTCLV